TALTFLASNEKPINKIIADPNNIDILWAISNKEVYRLDDGNNSYDIAYTYTSTGDIYGSQSRIIDIEFDPSNSDNVFISTNGFSINTNQFCQGATMYKIS